MKLEDAPQPGWYPDPERSGLLRWWEGADWTDEHRALPTTTEIQNAAREEKLRAEPPASGHQRSDNVRLNPRDTEQIVSQVRDAAREEVDRAADILALRASTALRRSRSLVADYVDPIIRWIKIALVVGAIAVIAWFVFQFIVQATLLEWLGDRIDNFGD